MAIDLLVLPLSRYLAGAFVTPEMEQAWANGDDARIETPAGEVVICANGEQLGGPDAVAQSKKWRDAMDAYRDSLPHAIGAIEWNEDATGADVVATVTHEQWGGLTTVARKKYEKRQGVIAGLLSGRPAPASHIVNGGVFVDAAFARPFQKGALIFASLPTALVELSGLDGLDASAQAARAAFEQAATIAREHKLPLVVDA